MAVVILFCIVLIALSIVTTKIVVSQEGDAMIFVLGYFGIVLCLVLICFHSMDLGKKEGYGTLALDSEISQPLKVGVVYEVLAVYPRQNKVGGYITLVQLAPGEFKYYYFDKPLPHYFVKTDDGRYIQGPTIVERSKDGP